MTSVRAGAGVSRTANERSTTGWRRTTPEGARSGFTVIENNAEEDVT
jgi:hypothetical protein